MICLSILLSCLPAQQPTAPAAANAEAARARQTWNALQERFSGAAALSFEATGDFLVTSNTNAGRSLARIEVSVSVARPGYGEVHVAARAIGAPAEAAVTASSFGTEEGIWSVAHGSDRAFACGGNWNTSTELDDFAFLGPNWSGWCARRGAADVVSFVPAHAEHPGLTGLRVRWNAKGEEGQRSTIFWVDGTGEPRSADVRMDAETVLHWNFKNFNAQQNCDAQSFVAVLPQGFVRNGVGVSEASAQGDVGLTAGAQTVAPRSPSPIEGVIETAIEQNCGNAEPAPRVEPATGNENPVVNETPVVSENPVVNEIPAIDPPSGNDD